MSKEETLKQLKKAREHLDKVLSEDNRFKFYETDKGHQAGGWGIIGRLYLIKDSLSDVIRQGEFYRKDGK